MAFDLNKEVQDFGPYQLVIRHPKDARAFAVLWRGGEKLAFAEGDTREKAYDEMLRLLGVRQLENAKEHASAAPSAEKVAHSFRFLWGHLNSGQQAMLRALHKAPGRQLSATGLAEAAKYASFEPANLWLGRAGVLFNQECPRPDMLLDDKGKPVQTSWFCTWSEPKRTWSLRPEVADGMQLAGCVAA